jgi:hypothetical protein
MSLYYCDNLSKESSVTLPTFMGKLFYEWRS